MECVAITLLEAAVTNHLVRKRILLVDDEAAVRLTLPRVLGKYGFEVTSVASVDDAIKEIKVQKFDALLSDLNLPQPNEGFTVIRAMRRHQPRCVNFVIAGDGSVEKEAKQKVAGYFTKPVDIHELIQTIMDKLDGIAKADARTSTSSDLIVCQSEAFH